MDQCPVNTINLPIKILIRKPCRGYYLRWWYNGWHYWYFRIGQISYQTEGHEYRTLGTNGVEISSGQIPETLVNGIKTIAWSRSIYLLNDNGWANVMIHPSRNTIKNNHIDGYELFFILKIGSASVARLTYTPPDGQWISFTPQLGWTPAAIFAVDKHDIDFTFSEYGSSYALVVNVQSPSQDFAVTLYDLSWAMVINSITKITVYPLSQNTGAARNGVIELSLSGYSSQYIAVTQYQYLASQVFKSDKTTMNFIWDYYGIEIANYATLNVAPDQIITYSVDVTWIGVVINQTSKVVSIYPTGKNDSVARFGVVTLSCPDAPDIEINITHANIPIPDAPVATPATLITPATFYANWNLVNVADGYYLDVAEDAGFTSMVAGFDNLLVGAVLTKQVTGLSALTDYWYRVRAYNDTGGSVDSNVIKITTLNYTIGLDTTDVIFSYDQDCCFGCIVTVTSSHNWTAAWVSDDGHFTATSYAGASGGTTTIGSVGDNGTNNAFIQTLRFTCGTTTVDCTITQYKSGWECPI